MLAYTHADSRFDGPITKLLSVLHILIEILSRAHAEGGKGLNDFRFGTFIGSFQSDGVASMAMKGLKPEVGQNIATHASPTARHFSLS